MKKKVEKIEIAGIPVSIAVADRGDVENDSCWVTFDLAHAEIKGTLCEFIISLEKMARLLAAIQGFSRLIHAQWANDIFKYRCEFIKIDEE